MRRAHARTAGEPDRVPALRRVAVVSGDEEVPRGDARVGFISWRPRRAVHEPGALRRVRLSALRACRVVRGRDRRGVSPALRSRAQMPSKPPPQPGFAGSEYSRRCWFTFPTRTQVEQPIIWQMSRKFPDVIFDIRQASVQHEIGIMAVLLSGREFEVNEAINFLRSKGVTVEPIEKSVVEG